jgi:hypothetical protein
MNSKLRARDVDVVNGDLVVSIPGNGTVLVPDDEVLKLAAEKGSPVPEGDANDPEA